MSCSLILCRAGPKQLTFVLTCLNLLHIVVSCSKGLVTSGVTIPHGDIIIEKGQPLEIFCKLNDDYVRQHGNESSKNIIFRRNNDSVPREMIEIVNSSTIRLFVKEPPESESMYYCMLNNGSAVCLNLVVIGTEPKQVEDFSCMGYNYMNMTCSWTAPQNYVKTNYYLSYHFQGRNSRIPYKCPHIEPTNSPPKPGPMRCFWDLTTVPHYRQSQSIYFITLTMSNIFGNTSFKYNFTHFEHVIPGPPENLTHINKTSHSILLSWSLPISISKFPPGLAQRVIYQSEYDDKTYWQAANTSKLRLKDSLYLFNLRDLKYAHAYYDIRVSMRSNKALATDANMWSRFASVTVRTMSKLPDIPPRTNVGSFEIINGLPSREIYVYWQYIPDYMKNGENFSYKILSVEEDNIRVNLLPNETTNAFAKFKGASFKSYKFTIVSANEIGHSVNKSVVYVPEYTKRVPEPTAFTKIAFGEGTYELSWIAPVLKSEDDPVINYTIFWCSNERDRPYQCKGFLNWTEVDSTKTIHNITVPENEIFQFAISANTEKASSGMVWASCTVIHNKGIGKMKSLWIDHIGSTFIEVNWKLDCSDRIGSIEGFKIYYCPIVSPIEMICKETEKTVIVNGNPLATRGSVTGLTPYTTYMLTVSVITKHNSNSLQSDRLYNTTLEAVPDTPPQNVRVTNITNSSMTVLWAPPKAMNGVLRYYIVHYRSNNYSDKVKVDASHTEKVLQNLKSYTVYEVTVVACTVECSVHSTPVSKRTAIAMPGQMREPSIKFQNESLIHVSWTAPENPGGRLDFYELQIKERVSSKNTSRIINTTEHEWVVPNCAVEESYKIYYFSVRAINVDNDNKFVGEWSAESENYCRASPKIMIWVLGGVIIVFLIISYFILKKLWQHCKIMRDVEVKLPPGLAPVITSDVGLSHWPVPNLQKNPNDDNLKHLRPDTSADEELLLDKKVDGACETHDVITSGDSSGCSSGHESVISSLASGTNLSSTSDSGTEQPRTPTNDSISCENSLRQRRTGSDSIGWDTEISWPNTKGYVTMPNMEKPAPSLNNWPINKGLQVGNYCVLGVDTSVPETDTSRGYVPIPVTQPHRDPINGADQKTASPYVTCDSVFNKSCDSPVQQSTSPPYVKTGDLSKIPSSKYVSVKSSEPKPSSYVMVGDSKGHPFAKPNCLSILSTGELINIEPISDVNVAHMQKAAEDLGTLGMPVEVKTGEVISQKGKGECTQADSNLPAYFKTDVLSRKQGAAPPDFKDESTEMNSPEFALSSYCRLGWDSAKHGLATSSLDHSVSGSVPSLGVGTVETLATQSKPKVENTKGYVPHRHFESKMLKED